MGLLCAQAHQAVAGAVILKAVAAGRVRQQPRLGRQPQVPLRLVHPAYMHVIWSELPGKLSSGRKTLLEPSSTTMTLHEVTRVWTPVQAAWIADVKWSKLRKVGVSHTLQPYVIMQ